jgi:hypothetical protein
MSPTAGRMPTFLIIGAAKSGTTACYHYLKAHPDIYMSPVKEPRFFAYEGRLPTYTGSYHRAWVQSAVIDLKAYQQLFDGATTEHALGEASVLYMHTPGCAQRIRAHIPDVRLVAILRDPVERAYSQFLHHVREGLAVDADFLQALDAESLRLDAGWAPPYEYANRGLYYSQLSRFYAVFSRDQIRVYLYEDFRREPRRVLSDLYDFLGTNRDFVPSLDEVYNPSGVPKSRFVYRAFQSLAKVGRAVERKGLIPSGSLDAGVLPRVARAFQHRLLDREPMPDEARVRLRRFFREDTLKLQDLLRRDLSRWL